MEIYSRTRMVRKFPHRSPSSSSILSVNIQTLTNSLFVSLGLFFFLCFSVFSLMEINRHPEEELMKDMQVRQKFSRPTGHERCPTEEVKLAATAISLNVRLRPSDMPLHMQDRALRYTRSLLDDSVPLKSHPNPTHLARALKKEFDSLYGPAWHCVVGTSFGSFVTHSPGAFFYFSIDSLSVLLFKTEVQLVTEPAA